MGGEKHEIILWISDPSGSPTLSHLSYPASSNWELLVAPAASPTHSQATSSSHWEELEPRQTQHNPGCNSSRSHPEGGAPGASLSTELPWDALAGMREQIPIPAGSPCLAAKRGWLWLLPEPGMLPRAGTRLGFNPWGQARARHQPGAASPSGCPFPSSRSCLVPALSQSPSLFMS